MTTLPPTSRNEPPSSRLRRRAATPRQRRVGIGLLAAAFLLGMFGLIYLTGTSDTATERAEVAESERDQVAQDVQNVAGPVAALCTAGGAPAAALESAGLCGVARQALVSPVVTRVTDGLTPDQIDAIVQRVLALSPTPAGTDAVVAAVLAQLRADPSIVGGLTEAQVRAIVLAVMAENPPVDGDDGADGDDGTSFGGLTFVLQDGQCTAVVTLIRADGSTVTQTSTVGSAACADTPAPDPDPVPDPDPEPAPDPDPVDPPAAVQPEPSTAPQQQAPPVTTSAPPPPDQGDGILPGIIG